MGNVAFRKIQIGEESTEGTAVAATAMLDAGAPPGGIVVENRASLVRRATPAVLALHGRQHLAQQVVGLRFDGDLTPEQVLYLLHMGVKGNVTPSGTASPYTWTFTKATTAEPTLDSFTIEYGDDTQAYEVNGCIAESIEFSGGLGGGELCQMSADIYGWTRTTTTFTSLSVPSVTPLAANYSRLYVDTTWAGLGGSELTAELLGWRLSLPCSYPIWRGTNLYPAGHGIEPTAATFELRMEFTANAATELAAVEAGTSRFIRILVAKDANHSFQIDGCFVWDPASIFDADRGDNIVALSGQSMYDSTGTKELEIVVVNTVATLP